MDTKYTSHSRHSYAIPGIAICFSLMISACNQLNRYSMNSSSSEQDLEKKQIEIDILSNPDLDSDTRLHLAVWKSNIEVVRMLLSYEGINVNEKSKLGYTLLHSAAKLGKVDILNELIKHGANVNEKDINNYTPLHLAVWKGNIEAVRGLLSFKGINVNEKSELGYTALHIGASKNHVGVVKLLLETKGILINEKTNCENTPLDLARKNRHKELVELLTQAGAVSGRKTS